MGTQSDMEFLLGAPMVKPISYVVLYRSGHLNDRILRRFRECVGNENVTFGPLYSSMFDPALRYFWDEVRDRDPRPEDKLRDILSLGSTPGDPVGTFAIAFCHETPSLCEYLERLDTAEVNVIRELALDCDKVDLIVEYLGSCEPTARHLNLKDRAFTRLVRSMLETKLTFREIEEQFDFLLFSAFDESGQFSEPVLQTQRQQGRARLMETLRAFLGAYEKDSAEAFVAEVGHSLDTRLSGPGVLSELIRITTEVIENPITERKADQSRRQNINRAISTWTPLFLSRYSDLETLLCQDRSEGAAAPLAKTSALHRLAMEFAERLRDYDVAHRGLWSRLRTLARSISLTDGGRANALRELITLFATTLTQRVDRDLRDDELAAGFAELQCLSTYLEQGNYEDDDDNESDTNDQRISGNEHADTVAKLEALHEKIRAQSL